MLTGIEIYSSLSTAPDIPLTLGGTESDDPVHVREIKGLNPVKAEINTEAYGSLDGDYFTGSRIGPRNIVLNLGLNPDWVNDTPATLRDKIYGYLMTRYPVALRFFRDNGPTCHIAGYVESCEPNIFSQDLEMQVSIICPQPDFVAVGMSTVEGVGSSNPEAVSFTSVGTLPTPVQLEVSCPSLPGLGLLDSYQASVNFVSDAALAPCPIGFKISKSRISAKSTYRLSTAKGAKLVQMYYEPSGAITNFLPAMVPGSIWPVVTPGTNEVKVITEGGSREFPWKMTYFEHFGGL